MSAGVGQTQARAEAARAVRAHALGWLTAANAVGLLLAALLVWPQAGDRLGPFGYGRWMPLHLNWQLYGWCALPLAGALALACIEPAHPAAARHVRLAMRVWSVALLVGGAAWLAGVTSGKLFLDWAGWARAALAVAMSLLWTLLAAHLWWGRSRRDLGRRLAAGVVVALAAVPALLYWAAGREVYPSVNPDSGGATGASLLGSTLGIVAIYGLLPLLLNLQRRDGRGTGWFWGALGGSFGVFALLDHGHASHHALGQILGLALLLAWVPLLWTYGRAWVWSQTTWRWVRAAGGWWALLVATGWLSFLPGWAERTKFTHALVAHAHLAMAGLVSSVGFAVLDRLDPATPVGGRRIFLLWQGGAVVHVVLLAVIGVIEASRPADLFYGDGLIQALFFARLAAGGLMAFAGAMAWREACVIKK